MGGGSGGGAGGGAGGGDAGVPGVPVILASGFDHGQYIASDGTSVFFGATDWHEADGGFVQEARIVQVPVAGGPMTTRFSYSGGAGAQGGTGAAPGNIVVDGPNVFFCASQHLWRMPIAGGSAVDLSPTGSPPLGPAGCGDVVVDALNVYSGAGSNDYTVFSLPKDGGDPNYFAGHTSSNTATVGGPMASDGTYVYWVPYSSTYSHTMQRAVGTGGSAETFVAESNPDGGGPQLYLGFTTSNLIFTGGSIFWMEFSTGFLPLNLWKASATGGSGAVPTLVASGSLIYDGIASDGAFIYWAEGLNGAYSIHKTSVAGGGPNLTVVPDSNSFSAHLAVDATNVYWMVPPNLYKAQK